MKYIIITLLLSWVWLRLFRRIVLEEIADRAKLEPINISFTIPNLLENEQPNPLIRQVAPYHISRNPLVMLWFGTFTYFMANVWIVWINFLFGMLPEVEANEDDVVENDD